MFGQTAVSLFPVQNYNFGEKAAQPAKDTSVEARIQRIRQQYPKQGARRSVEAVLLVQEHRFPHVLLLQSGGDNFRLPGGRLRPGEPELDGLRRKLTKLLSPEAKAVAVEWQVGECVGQFWRPGFDFSLYPYQPAHITKPKEIKKLFLVPLPEKCFFAVPTNLRLIAVPLYELYDNAANFGPVVAAVPHMIGRFRLNMAGAAPAPLALPAANGGGKGPNKAAAPADDDELALQLYGGA